LAHAHHHQRPTSQGEPNLDRATEIRRVTWITLLANVLISGAKLAAGILGHSQAVVADAVHGVSDSFTDVAVLVSAKFWSAPADERHPHGHRRIETLVSAAIGFVLFGVAAGIVWHALHSLRAGPQRAPGWVALIAALVSILGKEALYRWNSAVGRRIRSRALMANAWHHRSDGLSSIPAALAVLSARLLGPDWILIDHVGAVVVALFILRAAWHIVKPALGELIDAGASPDERRTIEEVAGSVQGVLDVHALRTRYSGSGLQVDLHIRVQPDLTVREGHRISEEVKGRLVSDGPGVLDVVVHLEPLEEGRLEDAGQS
jgi:cation diffusion facilitator family transporter